MEAAGVWVTGGRRVFRSNCLCLLGGSRCNQGGGKSGVSVFKKTAPSEKHGASKTVPTGLRPSFSHGYWGTPHPIAHVEQCYLGSSWLSAWWQPPRSWKMAAAITSRFYWPHLTHTVLVWVSGCDVCHLVKYCNQLPRGLLQPLPIPETWIPRVNINLSTKLPATARDCYDSIVTIVNTLTKRV